MMSYRWLLGYKPSASLLAVFHEAHIVLFEVTRQCGRLVYVGVAYVLRDVGSSDPNITPFYAAHKRRACLRTYNRLQPLYLRHKRPPEEHKCFSLVYYQDCAVCHVVLYTIAPL